MQDYRLLLPALIVWAVAIIGPVDYVALVLIGLLTVLAGLLNDKWRAILVGAALIAAAISGLAHLLLRESDAITRAAKDSGTVTVQGIIDSHPRMTGGSFAANANVLTVSDGEATMTSSQSVRVTWTGLELNRGSAFTGTGRLRPLPGDFTTVAMLELSEVSEQGGGGTAKTIMGALREAVAERPWHAQLIPGVVLGDDRGLPEYVVEDMRILGLSHLTAVSGAHISLVIAVVLAVVGRRRPLIAGGLSLLALVGLVKLVGPEASVLRAGYMGTFVCLALAIRRATTAFPILCLVVMIVALTDIDLARSLGFQLSAVATGAIIAFAYPLQQRLEEYIPTALADVLAISLVAAVATGPLLLSIQDRASLWSAAANALVAPVVAPLTILGLVAALLLPLVPFLALPMLWVCELFTAWMTGVTALLITLPGSHLPTHIALIGHIAMVAALAATAYLGVAHYALTIITIFATAAALSSSFPTRTEISDGWEAIQCDVGQGSAFLARRDESVILVDVGPADGQISACLAEADISHVDLLVISHFDADHVKGLAELLDAATIGQVWHSPNLHPVYGSRWALTLLDRYSIPHHAVSRGSSYSASTGEPFVDVVGPRTMRGTETTTNADSLVVVITTDSHRTLVLADAPFERQLTLRGDVNNIDVVVVGHHGAADQSAELAEHLRPQVALFSVGENNYGHPTSSALEIWQAPAMARTDECGHIAITSDALVSGCRSGME